MLKTITKKVLSYSEIPEELTKDSWLSKKSMGSLVECHLDDDNNNELDNWILKNYPELKDEESFFIEMDY
jgi:hypothetical protein